MSPRLNSTKTRERRRRRWRPTFSIHPRHEVLSLTPRGPNLQDHENTHCETRRKEVDEIITNFQKRATASVSLTSALAFTKTDHIPGGEEKMSNSRQRIPPFPFRSFPFSIRLHNRNPEPGRTLTVTVADLSNESSTNLKVSNWCGFKSPKIETIHRALPRNFVKPQRTCGSRVE